MLELNGTILFFLVSFALFCFLLKKIFWEPITLIKSERDLKISLRNKEADLLDAGSRKASAQLAEEQEKNERLEQELIIDLARASAEVKEKHLKEIETFYLEEEKKLKANFERTLQESKPVLEKEKEEVKRLICQKIF